MSDPMNMPWKYDEEIFIKHFLNLLSVIMCACMEDRLAGAPPVCESAYFFGPASRGTSVSSCERQKVEPNKKSDARGAMDEPVIADKPRVPQQKPNSPKIILRSGFSGVPVRHFAKFIIFNGKVAAEWGEASFPAISASEPKRVSPKGDTHLVVVSTPKHAQPSKSQRLKRRRAARSAHIADVGFLSEQIINNKSAQPVPTGMWLWVVLMALQTLPAKAASGLSSTPALQKKWLLRALATWMVVQTTAASPIGAAAPPAPMSVVNFGAPETPVAGHRRLLSKVTAANWAELKTKCEAGDNEVTLSDSFDASSYAGQIDFSGKTCVVIGQGQTLDAKNAGRFFSGNGAGSSLEVHGLVLKNGNAGYVSAKCWSALRFGLMRIFSGKALTQVFALCPGA